MLWFKHILFHFTWKGTGQSTNALLQPSPDNNSSTFNCSCSLCQYGGISRWCWRQTGTLTKFLRPGSLLQCWSQLHSLSTSPLWCYSRPEAGCIVCSLCEVKVSRPRCKLPPSLPFKPLVFHGQYIFMFFSMMVWLGLSVCMFWDLWCGRTQSPMFSKSCRLVNEHLVSSTYVAYVSFLCHCVLHSMEDS